ncbi:MAG: hypothetical protein L6Q95_10800 [Planctomycetes bacterium]|nr:hypothetical protein [Planctomycetota bacterium]
MMDELNYRRLTSRPKTRCPSCGATSYKDPEGLFRCVVCNHDMFEVCLDCGHLTGWCECPPEAAVAVKTAARRGRAAKK